MPRPESPVDPRAGAVPLFAHDLRLLREKAGGPPYRALARRAHYASATLARAAAGRELPSLAVTLAYVRACGGDAEEWECRWRAVAADVTREAIPEPDRHPESDQRLEAGRRLEAERHPESERRPEADRHPEPERRPKPERHPGPERHPEPLVPAEALPLPEATRPAMRRRWLTASLVAALVLGGTTSAVLAAGTDPPPPRPAAGMAEMVDVHTAADGTIRAWVNTGDFPGWPWSDPVGMVLGPTDPALTRFADLDGDGFDELVRITADGAVTAWRNDKGFPDRPWHVSLVVGTSPTTDTHFADLDGDGRDEMITVDGVVRAWPNTGGFPGRPWGDPVDLGHAPPGPTWFADLDGDARAEVVTLDDTAHVRARRNTGAFPAPPWSAEVDLGPNLADPTCLRFADLDGDGFDELISINTDGTTTAWWNNHSFPRPPVARLGADRQGLGRRPGPDPLRRPHRPRPAALTPGVDPGTDRRGRS
ncbi:FG-GAP-like repeat-containing protein [Actinosynnema sp. NPDC050801]|uniref:FG-GAP-like repeat-containing protein n=1 Tax=unclassified Actinosynnema TaxID=2637065 RepID=UPI00340E1847